MASIRARKLSSGKISYQVQFRIEGTMHGASFATPEAAEAFGRTVDRVGGAAALKILQIRDKPDVAEMTLSNWTELFLTKANGMVGGITDRTRAVDEAYGLSNVDQLIAQGQAVRGI